MIPVNTPLLDGNEKKYLNECIDSGWISSEGPFVKRLETGFAKLMGCAHGIAVCNGSVAIDVPVVLDYQKDTSNSHHSLIGDNITTRTKAIMVLHIYGLPVDMHPVIA